MAVSVAVLCGLAVAAWLCIFAVVRVPLRLSESFLHSFVSCLQTATQVAQRRAEEHAGALDTVPPPDPQHIGGKRTMTTTAQPPAAAVAAHADPAHNPSRPHPQAPTATSTLTDNSSVVVRTIHHAADRKQLSADPQPKAPPRLPSVRSAKSQHGAGSDGARGNDDDRDTQGTAEYGDHRQNTQHVPHSTSVGGGGVRAVGALPRVAHEAPAGDGGGLDAGRSSAQTLSAPYRGPTPQHNDDLWEYDAGQGLYWSATRRWFYDPVSTEFYDPATNQWFNEKRGGWYTLPPSETRRRQQRSRSPSPQNPLPSSASKTVTPPHKQP